MDDEEYQIKTIDRVFKLLNELIMVNKLLQISNNEISINDSFFSQKQSNQLQFISSDFQQQQSFDISVSINSEDFTKQQPNIFQKKIRKKRVSWTKEILQQMKMELNYYSEHPKSISLAKIAFKIGVSTRQVQHCWQMFKIDPSLSQIQSRIGRNKKKRRSGKATSVYLDKLAKIIMQNGFLTAKQMAELINQQLTKETYDFKINPIGLSYVLKMLKRTKFTWKRIKQVPIQRHSPQHIQKRYHYCVKMNKILSDYRSEIFYLAQTAINIYMKHKKGWALPGQSANVVVPNSHDNIISLLCIIGPNGQAKLKMVDGSFTNDYFFNNLQQMINNIVGKTKGQKLYIIMDNYGAKDKNIREQLFQKKNFQVIVLPPQSPMLNPIELWFATIKSQIKKKNWENKSQLLKVVEQVLAKYTTYSLVNYINSVQKFIKNEIKRDCF